MRDCVTVCVCAVCVYVESISTKGQEQLTGSLVYQSHAAALSAPSYDRERMTSKFIAESNHVQGKYHVRRA